MYLSRIYLFYYVITQYNSGGIRSTCVGAPDPPNALVYLKWAPLTIFYVRFSRPRAGSTQIEAVLTCVTIPYRLNTDHYGLRIRTPSDPILLDLSFCSAR